MPIYEYQCKKCNSRFERLVLGFDESLPECPECRSSDVNKLMSAGCVRPHGIPTGSGGYAPPPASCSRGGG
ncbi:Zinc ribbon domain-containing protein [Desulfonema limicola]|uniref:Zinc ribbon domain-containing protein n=1 Tax=Desulfonema limicola TaxID=45656 RepID=A0A975B3P5_9BACT|nr:zinc ribbon domain-containing protein [Desulfonema limicola]QTA78204.1 Zinc ribbon domain-containing protein [Desulfonema limicola]